MNLNPTPHLPTLPSYWSDWHHQKGSLLYLKHWLADHASAAPLATDFDIALSLGHRLWELLDWTGQQDPCFEHVDSPVNCLQDNDAFIAKHQCNPTWSCGPLSATMIGLLAAQGIMARQVASSHLVTGGVDNVLEFWSRELKRWVLFIPHLNLSFAHESGTPLSLLDWCRYDRIGARPTPVSATGGKPRCVPDAFDCWFGMSRTPRVMRGNFPYAGGETDTTPIPPAAWESLPVLPFPPGVTTERTAVFGTFDPASVTNPPTL